MDETSTSACSSFVSEKMLRAALRGVSYGTPSERTLGFIREVARGLLVTANTVQ